MAEDLKKLDKYRKTRLTIAAFVFLIGLGAVISDSAQKSADKAEAEEAKKGAQLERLNLSNQVTKLIDQQTLARTEVESLQGQVTNLSGGVAVLAKPRISAKPDLHLKLVYPTSVGVAIYNDPKAGLANKPTYQITLCDLDNIKGNLLPIPVAQGDFIRPGELCGPNMAMELPAVKSIVKAGDRIFGYALVECPDCIKTRSYLIYIEQGKGGWWYEMTDKPMFPYSLTFYEQMKDNVNAWLDKLAPVSKRIPIPSHL